MTLKLRDLGITSQSVLRALAEQPDNRRGLSDKTGLSCAQVSRTLTRLAVFDLINRPDETGGLWALNAAGYALLDGATAPKPVSPVAELDNEPPEPTAEMSVAKIEAADTEAVAHAAPIAPIAADLYSPMPPANTDRIAVDLLAAMEVEVALDHVRTKMRSAAIPARSWRVYREVLNVLPPALVEALEPITTLVAAHNLQ